MNSELVPCPSWPRLAGRASVNRGRGDTVRGEAGPAGAGSADSGRGCPGRCRGARRRWRSRCRKPSEGGRVRLFRVSFWVLACSASACLRFPTSSPASFVRRPSRLMGRLDIARSGRFATAACSNRTTSSACCWSFRSLSGPAPSWRRSPTRPAPKPRSRCSPSQGYTSFSQRVTVRHVSRLRAARGDRLDLLRKPGKGRLWRPLSRADRRSPPPLRAARGRWLPSARG